MGDGDHDDEPLDEGAEGEHAPSGAPPDPMDRVWVHPTEIDNLPRGVAPRVPKSQRSVTRRARRLVVPAFAGAAGALVTVAILALTGSLDRGPTATHAAISSGGAPVGGDDARQLATRIGLSVVAIAARDTKGSRFGSGVCVRHAGEVLTSARLVGNAKNVDILTSDGQRHAARVIGRDRTTDLVLLAINSDANVPAAELADGSPKVGTSVWIMGASTAGGSIAWVSGGLLSAIDSIVVAPGGPTTGGLLQTDAATSGAATGGALVDEDGNVAGIVLGRLDANPITYVMPIGAAVDIAEQLRNNGVARHGNAGMAVADGPKGPTIMGLTPGGPAVLAGIRLGDVVSTVDGRAVESRADVMGIVRNDQPGRIVTIEVVRGTSEYKVRVTLASVTG